MGLKLWVKFFIKHFMTMYACMSKHVIFVIYLEFSVKHFTICFQGETLFYDVNQKKVRYSKILITS